MAKATTSGLPRQRKREKWGCTADQANSSRGRVPRAVLAGRQGFYHISWEYSRRGVAGRFASQARAGMFEFARREAFGRPIGKFQAIRHKFAEMATQAEAAKQFTYATAWRFANG